MSSLFPALISIQCPSGCPHKATRTGLFFRRCDQKLIQRYRCSGCKRLFSEATLDIEYRQRIRYVNPFIYKMLVGGYSQRRLALDLGVNRKTIIRKFIWMGKLAIELNAFDLANGYKVSEMQFDEMETSVHSKCKPIAIPLAVEKDTRRILGFAIASMPAKGKLAQIAKKKYGHRADERKAKRKELFEKLKPHIEETVIISSDKHPSYPKVIKDFFPKAQHRTTKGIRGCVVGQGELKASGRDPLFSFNHTAAMIRANVNRFFRKTWCTTKKIERLNYHLALYVLNHNRFLITHGKAR